jgi:hypothetical protein
MKKPLYVGIAPFDKPQVHAIKLSIPGDFAPHHTEKCANFPENSQAREQFTPF